LSNLPVFVSSDFESNILAFTLMSKGQSGEVDNFLDLCFSIANSVVDGAQDIQLNMQKNVHIIKIDTDDIKATDFKKMNKSVVDKLMKNGINSVRKFIDNEILHYKQSKINSNFCSSHSQSYQHIAQTVGKAITNVVVSELDSGWVYDLFPSLLYWAQSGADVSAVFKKNNDNEVDGPLRRRILDALGVNVQECVSLPTRCFLFNSDDFATSFAVVRRLPYVSNDQYDSIIYDSPTDSQVIMSLGRQFSSLQSEAHTVAPRLESVDSAKVIGALKKVHQYSPENVSIYLAEIDVKELLFLTNYVLGYKYRQISHFFDAYAKAGIKLFKPSKVVYCNGKESLVGLPVLEKYGQNLYIVNGNTRIKYCIQHGIETIFAVIVEGVSDPLPTSNFYSHSEVIVTDRPVSGTTRYGKSFDYAHYRHIEKAFRNPSTCMI
jgi:hypothetical protein